MIVRSVRTWVLGDNVDTDALAPGIYMKGPIEEMAKHCLETVEPSFAAAARPGDTIAAGDNFGVGSSREQAAEALKYLGIGAVVARSFGRIFYRNALNLGLPVVVSAQAGRIGPGDALAIDVAAGRIDNLSQNQSYACEPIPPKLLEMIADGGLIPHLEKKFAARRR